MAHQPLGIFAITHTIFDVGQLRLRTDLPREIVRLAESGRPIERLFA